MYHFIKKHHFQIRHTLLQSRLVSMSETSHISCKKKQKKKNHFHLNLCNDKKVFTAFKTLQTKPQQSVCHALAHTIT